MPLTFRSLLIVHSGMEIIVPFLLLRVGSTLLSGGLYRFEGKRGVLWPFCVNWVLHGIGKRYFMIVLTIDLRIYYFILDHRVE